MWVKHVCVDTKHTDGLTDWWTTHEAKGGSKTKMVFLLLYWCLFKSSWPVAKSYVHTTWICPLHLKTNTHTFYHSILLSLKLQGPRLQNCPGYIFSLHQTSVFYLPLSYSILPPRQSISLSSPKNCLQEPTKLHCHVTLTSQLKWYTWLQCNHNKISTPWQQPQLLI